MQCDNFSDVACLGKKKILVTDLPAFISGHVSAENVLDSSWFSKNKCPPDDDFKT